MSDTQTTKAAETTRVKQKTEDRPPPEREHAPSALAATLYRAAGSDDPTTPPDHLARVVGRLTAPHQAGFLLQCQRRYGNAYVQRMISSRDNGHSPLDRQASTQEEPTARQITAPDVATTYAERTSPSGVLQNPVGQAKPLIVSIAPIVRRQKTKDDDEDKRVQSESAAPPAGGFDAGEELETRLSQNKGGGSPLPDSVRSFMEPRFGVDFGRVRVHTGNDAIQMNRDVSAQAFTHGADIYYGAGSSPTNLQLTAHELTHVVQQTGGAPLPMKKQAPHSMGTLEPAVPPAHGGVVQRQEQDEGPGFVETLAWDTLESLAPNLAPLARKGPEGVFDWIKERASDAAAGVFDTLMAPVRAVAGVGAKLSEQFMPLVATLQDAATKIASNDCTPLQQAAAKIEHIAEQIITPIIEFVQPIVAKIQEFLGLVWDKLGAPIWEWIQQYASQRWQEIKQLASWIWDIVEPISKLGKEAWEWLKKTIGIGEGPEGENGILQWLQGKLQAAWDWVKQQLEPFNKQLTVIKAVIVEVAQIVSPEGPVRAILAVASQAASGIGWLKDNFGSGDAIVKARVYLEKTLLPPLAGALKKLGDTVTGLAGSVSAALSKLANNMLQAVAAASGSVVAFAASAVQWIADQISALAGWANQQLTSLAQMLQSALGTLLGFVNNFLEFLGKVGTVILDVWGLPLFLAEKVWNWVPACIRDPIVDFVIPIILRQIELFEELVRDNEAWQKTKAAVMKLIRQVFVDHDLMGALKGTFNLILRTFNIPPDLAVTVAQKALAAWDIVVKQPLEFIKNTVRALGHGFKLLWANLTDHLEYGIKGWLLGSIADKDIQFPTDWTKPREVFGFVMDVLGLSVSHIFELLKTRINPKLVTKAQTWLTRFQGAWNWITSMIDTSKSPAENAKGVMDKAKDFGKSILTGVVEWVSAKVAEELAILAAAAAASGGLSEVVDIARRIYKAMVSAKRWAGRILEMANETLDDIAAIASGAVEKAGEKFKDIMHKGMPVVIGFLADQVGLGGVGSAMRDIIDKLRAKVDEAVLWLIDKVKAGIEALINAVSGGAAKPDERTDAQKQADLDKGVAEATTLLENKELPPAQVKKKLPAIKSKYNMTLLELVTDAKTETKETDHIHGEINPGKNSANVEKDTSDVDKLKKEASEAMAKEAETGIPEGQVADAVERVKRRVIHGRAHDLAAERRPDGSIAVSFREDTDYFPLGFLRQELKAGAQPPGRTVESVTRLQLVSDHPITDLSSILPKTIRPGGLTPTIPTGGGTARARGNEILMLTWNSSPMEQSPGSHAEAHTTELVESDPAKEALKYVESIEIRNFSKSACTSCSDALVGMLRIICAAQRETGQIVFKRADIYWTQLFEKGAGQDSTTWSSIETLATAGWTIHAPVGALPDPKDAPNNSLAQQVGRRPLSRTGVVIEGKIQC